MWHLREVIKAMLALTKRVANVREDDKCVMEDSLWYRWRVAWHEN